MCVINAENASTMKTENEDDFDVGYLLISGLVMGIIMSIIVLIFK